MDSKSTRKIEHIFGPVPSRRLGRSLGIDLIPSKTCTYDCLYCQVGRTTRKTIERKIRAYNPWPGAYTFTGGKPACRQGRRLIIAQAEIKNNALKIKRVKPEGKNEMDFADFLRGNPEEIFKKFL